MLLGAAGVHRDAERLQQVLGRLVIAVRILHAGEDRELAARPHVHLELGDAVDDVIVHTLGVLAVAVAARLPIAFEDVPGIVAERAEQLRISPAGGDQPMISAKSAAATP